MPISVGTLPDRNYFVLCSTYAICIALLAGLPVDARANSPAVVPTTSVAEVSSATDNEKPSSEAPADESAGTTTQAVVPDEKVETERAKKKVRLAYFTLKDSLPESPGQMGPFGDLQSDLRQTVERMEKAAADDSVEGAVLDLRQPAIGRGKLLELRGAISRFRATGKKVYANLEVASTVDYLIACACDKIVMPESGFLILPGVHAEATFYKGMFNKLGVKADFMHIGPYKSAAQPFMREEMSPEVRENLTSVIDDIYDQMLTMIAADRLTTVEKVKCIIDNGILSASQAKEAGLIDRIEYADTFRSKLAEAYEADPLVYVENYGKKDVDTDFSGPLGLVKLVQLMMGMKPGSAADNGQVIAVVYATGPITTGESQQDPFGAGVMGSATIVEALQTAAEDDQVAAIVLRVDSPGGSAVASDLIWRETQRIKKPIVASMSDVAGSGGYYIAMGADRIFAAPGTITGSIGVVAGKFAVTGLYDKIGISTETIHRGRNSGMFGGSGKFSDSERAAMERFMAEVYAQFTSKAAAGRRMPLEKLQSVAEGRIFTGRQAKRNGLVDELGTLEDAIAAAKELAGLAKDQEVRLRVLPEPKNFFESLLGDGEAEKEVRLIGRVGSWAAPQLAEPLKRAFLMQTLLEEPVLVLMPFELTIR